MSIEEFSNGFDTLLQSYTLQPVFGHELLPQEITFDEYEKSYFLTEAQKVLVRETYSNAAKDPTFESEEKIREALEVLVSTQETVNLASSNDKWGYYRTPVSIPSLCWYIVYEEATFNSADACLSGKAIEVIPIKYDELIRVLKNPFRGPDKRRILRLNPGESKLELVSKYPLASHYMKYVKEPEPILLVPVPEELGFKYGGTTVVVPQTCKLNTAIHSVILNRAVQMAVQSKVVALGGSKKE